jgi:AcrR family transcriptional regulator
VPRTKGRTEARVKLVRGGRRRGRPTGGSEDLIRAILDATLEELGANGYEAMSVEAVARRACVNKTSIYRRWPTRKSLVVAAIRSLHDEMMIAVPDTGTLGTDLLAFCRTMLAKISTPRGASVARALMASAELGQILRGMRRQYLEERTPSLLRRAVERGEAVDGLDEHVVHELLVAPIFHRAFITHERVSEAFLQKAVGIVLQGVLRRPGVAKGAGASSAGGRASRSTRRSRSGATRR